MTASNSELEILAKLIENGPSKATELHKHFQKKWGAATVITFLRRLQEKELVQADKKEGTRAHIYSPTKSGLNEGKNQLRTIVKLFFGKDIDAVNKALKSRK